MGLDMYLDAEVYASKFTAKRLALDLDTLTEKHFGLKRDPEGSLLQQATLSVRVGYWRKANAIHGWFVRECQEGKDECQRTLVPSEKLAVLHQLCVKASDALTRGDKDEVLRLLPPVPGFFFGSTDIDDWYKGDLDRTIEIINGALAARDKFLREQGADDRGEVEFYYHASW